MQFLLPLLLLSSLSFAQGQPQPAHPQDIDPAKMQQHYDAARTFQLSGDSDRAAQEYGEFLVEALRISAKAMAGLGQQEKAALLFEDALRLAPGSPETRLDYAQLRFQQQKMPEARAMVEQVLASAPSNPRAQSLLGQILFEQGDYKDAREHLESAVADSPDFELGYLLGVTYIKLNDFSRARLVFDEMLRSFGDTAKLHMMFGRAYKQGSWEALDNAVNELKLAIGKDGKAPRAHFLLALAYIDRDGESAFPQAAPELQSELSVNPNDARSHYLLGYIHLKQHDNKVAEMELLRAAELDPKNPDPLIYLGEIFSDADRDSEAEAALRKALTLAGDASASDYLLGRAHYILGRVLLKAGKREEGTKELAASQAMRDQLNRPDTMRDRKGQNDPELKNLSQEEIVSHPPTVEIPTQSRDQVQAYLNKLKPAIADSYNNLGVIQAGHKEFAVAVEDFRKAGDWNPGLEMLDRNLGLAAFYAKNYKEAAPPLSRQLTQHPDDVKVRAALALSLFIQEDFKGTLETLKPIQQDVDKDPGLDYAYSLSLVKVGEYDEGTRRLKSLAEANPNSADIHMLLGSALADQQQYESALEEYRKSLAIDPNQAQTHYLAGLALIRSGKPKDAADELRTALKLNSVDVATKYHLAFSLIQLQQKAEAESLLRQVIQQDPNRADAYYELGKLQLEEGNTKAAVQSLETGVKVSPNAEYIHYQLAMAYRQDSRTDDAEREIKIYQSLKNRERGRGDAPQPN